MNPESSSCHFTDNTDTDAKCNNFLSILIILASRSRLFGIQPKVDLVVISPPDPPQVWSHVSSYLL